MKHCGYRGEFGDQPFKMLQIDEDEQIIIHIHNSKTDIDKTVDIYSKPGVLSLEWEENAQLIDW